MPPPSVPPFKRTRQTRVKREPLECSTRITTRSTVKIQKGNDAEKIKQERDSDISIVEKLIPIIKIRDEDDVHRSPLTNRKTKLEKLPVEQDIGGGKGKISWNLAIVQ